MLVDDYTLKEKIGEGSFGEVYLASKKGENRAYAVKVIDYKFKRNAMKYLNNEINILKDANHPNILKCFEIKETSEKIYIITEYYNGGTLENFLETYRLKYNNFPSEEIVQYIMRQIIEGIKYLHNKHIIYRAVNLTNIMINYEDENDRINNNIMKAKIKIIDFGFSKYLKKGELTNSVLGYPINMDPIILFKLNKISEYKDNKYDEKVDIWSLGIQFYQLLVGKNPFETDDLDDLDGLVEKIKNGDYYEPITITKEAISFLINMLQFEPKDRLNIDILYYHEFLRKKVSDFTKLKFNEKIS